MKRSKEVLAMLETGIMISIALILDLVFGEIYSFPMGGSISLSMLPIFIVAARRGLKYGLVAGVLFGVLQTLIKVYFLSIPQYVMDYLVSFMVIGFAGLVKDSLNKPGRLTLSIVLGSFLRLVSASITGLIYWRSFIPDEIGFMDQLFGGSIFGLFSTENGAIIFAAFLYNSLYLVPSAILCVIVGLILQKRKILAYHLEVEI